jgi:hypothetical protein
LHRTEDLGRVGALWTRALEVGLASKLVSQRPSYSIGDKPALDRENDMPKEGHATRRLDAAPYPLRGGCVSLEENARVPHAPPANRRRTPSSERRRS